MSNRVLIRPYVTEKTTRQMEEESKYSFVVDMRATKPAIREAVEMRYPGVDVQNVRTMIMPAKRRRQYRDGNMIEGRTSGFKKAVIQIDPDGEQIDFFESI
jgi:large subunit ribosomal protein L23